MRTEHAIYLGLAVSALWSIICRINRMDSGTPHWVFFKYAVLALGVFSSIVWPMWRDVCVMLGVSCYLAISTKRWDLYKSAPPAERAWGHPGARPWLIQRLWDWMLRH